MRKYKKILHANKAKIDDEKQIIPLFETMPTTSNKSENDPLKSFINQINAVEIKEATDENHK